MRASCLPGASVSVRVGGEDAVEYGPENDGTKATSFIEAILGASFAIVLEIEQDFAYRQPQDRLEFRVFIDGQITRSKVTPTHQANVFQ
jgi:hypothetical protein